MLLDILNPFKFIQHAAPVLEISELHRTLPANQTRIFWANLGIPDKSWNSKKTTPFLQEVNRNELSKARLADLEAPQQINLSSVFLLLLVLKLILQVLAPFPVKREGNNLGTTKAVKG